MPAIDDLNTNLDELGTAISGLQADLERLRAENQRLAADAVNATPIGAVNAAAGKVRALIESVSATSSPVAP